MKWEIDLEIKTELEDANKLEQEYTDVDVQRTSIGGGFIFYYCLLWIRKNDGNNLVEKKYCLPSPSAP